MGIITLEYSHTWVLSHLGIITLKYFHTWVLLHLLEHEKNAKKWQKMTQQMLKNETGDWNILERTQKKSKGLSMVQNDKKCHCEKNDRKWQTMTQKGPRICSKIDVTP